MSMRKIERAAQALFPGADASTIRKLAKIQKKYNEAPAQVKRGLEPKILEAIELCRQSQVVG